jgi:glycosyltransferase involved in cell wall biosynthesis
VSDLTSIPRVSIITPAYNAGGYIEATLNSALSQTMGDFELIVVDDGSTDETVKMAERVAARDPRVRVITQTNQGVAAARNTAMDAARADIFALLDSDDLWMRHYLSEQIAIFDASPAIDIVSVNAISMGGSFHGQPLRPVADGYSPVSLLDMIETENAMSIMAMFRRRVVERIGGFDVEARTNEDYDFWFRAACAGSLIVFNGSPGGCYRRRGDSMSNSEERMLAGATSVLTKRRPLCASRPVELAAIDRQIDRYTRRWLLTSAKNALLRHEFDVATERLQRLAEKYGEWRFQLQAQFVRFAPQLARVLYLMRSASRGFQRRVEAGPLGA